MKLTAILIALCSLLLLAAAAPEAPLPSAAPAGECAEAPAAPEATAELPAEPAWEPLGGPSAKGCFNVGPCDRWDSSYCDYYCAGWDCCKAVILIPNSNCPNICA